MLLVRLDIKTVNFRMSCLHHGGCLELLERIVHGMIVTSDANIEYTNSLRIYGPG